MSIDKEEGDWVQMRKEELDLIYSSGVLEEN